MWEGSGAGRFSAIDGSNPSIGKTDEGQAAPADSGIVSVDDSQNQRGGDRRVDGVTSLLQDLLGGLGRERMDGCRCMIGGERNGLSLLDGGCFPCRHPPTQASTCRELRYKMTPCNHDLSNSDGLAMKPQAIERTLGERVRWSIVQEASAYKAGNVHPGARFADMDYSVFVEAAQAIGEAVQRTIDLPLGQMVGECTNAMLHATGINTSLGTILLLAPLVQCDRHGSGGSVRARMRNAPGSEEVIQRFLEGTTFDDCSRIYRAIASCKPGGLGTSQGMDVFAPPPSSILSAMRFAASWDDIALQYTNGYREVADYARRLVSSPWREMPLPDAIRVLQLAILSERVDSLIVRKCGLPVGLEVQQRARLVQQSAPYGTALFETNWAQFDSFLRHDGHRKNPGTTADLIAAALYLASDSWT